VLVLAAVVLASVCLSADASMPCVGMAGECISKSLCKGTTTSGKCPGTPNDVMCCTTGAPTGPTTPPPSTGAAGASVVQSIAGVNIKKLNDGRAVFYTAKIAIDADGAYRAYHPKNIGLDFLANGGHPGNWWALVTDNGRASGTPLIQTATDPAPGYYISTTSLQNSALTRTNPKRYVDSESIPYIVLPGGKLAGARLGDLALVFNTQDKTKRTAAIVADSGPMSKIGEASIACSASVLGPGKGNPKNGGTEAKIIRYIVFPGSGNGQPQDVDAINQRVTALFAALTPDQQALVMA